MIDSTILTLVGAAAASVIGASVFVVKVSMSVGSMLQRFKEHDEAIKMIPSMSADLGYVRMEVGNIRNIVDRHDEDIRTMRTASVSFHEEMP